jgi:hypothetical protein
MKTLMRALAGLLAIAALAGCATGYQKRGVTGGYTDSKIDDTHYIVKFDGNGFADKDRVWHFWIYRCAQLTKEKGYTYFSLESVANKLKNTSFNPDDDQPHLADTVLRGDADGHVIDVHGGGVSYIYVPGQTITTWHSNALVTMYNSDIPEQRAVYHAQTIIDALAEYIRTNGKSMPPDQHEIFERSAFGLTTDHRLVNIHQYLQEHPQVARTRPRPPVRPIDQYDVSRPPAMPNGPVVAASRITPPPPPAPRAPPQDTPKPAVVEAPAASMTPPGLSAAEATASQIGCGDVRANGNNTFTAQCSSYRVLITCDGEQCRPQHVIK